MMKSILTTLFLILSVTFGAQAQKVLDLSIAPYFPMPDGEYPNLSPGDTLPYYVIVTNNGPGSVIPTDTMKLYIDLKIVGADGYSLTLTRYGASLTTGQHDTFGYLFIQGALLGTTAAGDSVFVNVPSNTTIDTNLSYVWGYDGTDGLFDDLGITLTDSGGTLDMAGNNVLYLTNIKFGTVDTGGTDTTDSTGTGIAQELLINPLQLYPNPVRDELHFDYCFDIASNAWVSVYDINGRIVLSKEYGHQGQGNNKFTLSVASLPNGTYTLEMRTERQKMLSKFTVLK